MQLHKLFKWHPSCPTGQLTRSSGPGEPGLQSEGVSQYRSSGGVELVATSPDPLEWENHSSEVNTNGDSVRCLSSRSGAVCEGVSTGGSWTPQEQLMHINCLELLAADLALKSFLNDQQGITEVRLDAAPSRIPEDQRYAGALEIDLFASRLTYQLPQFFSWAPDPQAVAVDAFQQDWSQLRGYANPHGAWWDGY